MAVRKCYICGRKAKPSRKLYRYYNQLRCDACFPRCAFENCNRRVAWNENVCRQHIKELYRQKAIQDTVIERGIRESENTKEV